MQKLLKGALTFRRHVFAAYRDLFERLSHHGQSPEALFISCSDSRVVPNLITATDPGDLFVLRNIGNIIPPYDPNDRDNAEAAALEYALKVLEVGHIVVCGHSGCGAMRAVLESDMKDLPHARSWLRHSEPAVQLLDVHRDSEERNGNGNGNGNGASKKTPAPVDLLSELNVLVQLKHIKTYPVAMELIEAGRLHLHAWFFEIETAQVYAYNPVEDEFLPIDQTTATAATAASP